MLHSFWTSERGAVSVEWTLKTGLLATLALSIVPMLLVLVAGTGHKTSARVGVAAMPNTGETGVQSLQLAAFHSFSDGWETDWNFYGTSYDDPVLVGGPTLLVRDDEILSRTFDVPAGSEAAYIDLDFYSLGDLEPDDRLTITIDGVAHVINFDKTNNNIAYSGSSDISISNTNPVLADTATLTDRTTVYDVPGNTGHVGDINNHQNHKIRLRVDAPGTAMNVELSITGATGSNRMGEAITLDSLRVTAVNPG